MSLSKDLVSQFVKITNDEPQKTEKTFYGTIVDQNDSKFVRLDGAERLTPISMTTDANDGERVIVMIKNHSAVVTGNVSSPAARTDDLKEVDAAVGEVGDNLSKVEGDLSDVTMRVTNAETSITNNEYLISLAATKTEVSDTLDGYYTKVQSDALLSVAADEIKSTVSQTYATISEVDGVETRLSSAESSITQHANKIATNVTEIDDLGTRMSDVEQTADGITVTLTNVQNDISGLEDDVSDAQSTANSAQTAASNAQSTANSAQTAASDAAKTATNYLNLSSSGLTVGQNPSNPSAGNVLISTEGIRIREGTDTIASFLVRYRSGTGYNGVSTSGSDGDGGDGSSNTTISSTGSGYYAYIDSNDRPLYISDGWETDNMSVTSKGVTINTNMVLDGKIYDDVGGCVFASRNSSGNTVVGYGRYSKSGNTHVYGQQVKAKTKSGFAVSVNGAEALQTNNANGNATFGYHLYSKSGSETNIYGYNVALYSTDKIRLFAGALSLISDDPISCNNNLLPNGTDSSISVGNPTYPWRNFYFDRAGVGNGLRVATSGSSLNVVGMNDDDEVVYGNTSECTNIISKSTTTSSTGYSFKIICGDDTSLTHSSNDGRLLLAGGTDSTSRYLCSPAVYKRTYSSAANVYVTENGMLGRSTSSSRRYKRDIKDAALDSVKGLYDLPIHMFKYNDDQLMPDDERYQIDIPGFIAEEVDEHFPIGCDHILDENGELVPEMWNSQIIIPAMLKLIQDLNERLKQFEPRRDKDDK